ncbi:Cadmium-transporting ATPase [Bertholletia excelsa]
MSRLLAFGNVRRFVNSLLPSQKTRYSEINGNGIKLADGFPYFLCRLYPKYRLSHKGFTSCKLFEGKESLWKAENPCPKNFYVLSASNTISHHAQIAWKHLSQICSYTGPVLPPISRIACAVSLALTRSQVVAPGLFAFLIGELAWTCRRWAEAEHFPMRNTLYMHAQDGQVYLTSFLFSVIEGLVMLFRAIYLAILFSPCIIMAPFSRCLGMKFRKTWVHIVHLTLEKAGPAFIKWGQWAAARPDLFPRDLCIELAKLHTKAPAHSYTHTKRTIERAFGRKLHEIFEKFEEEPVASGSIAQVHRATLKFRYPGQQVKPILVAVKVRHPGVGEAIRRDFMLINLVAKVSKLIPSMKWFRLDESVQQFAVFMLSQVDLAREAANLSRFIYNFRRWKHVSFPKPLYPLVHPEVLVETYEHGDSVLYYVDELQGIEHIKTALAHIGSHALLKMLLVDNFLHADMHPGNILVRSSRSKASSNQLFRSRPHVIFLDVGMTAELSRKERVTLLEFFKAVALRDGRTAAQCTLKLSEHQSCPNPEAFIKEVERTFSYWGSEESEFVHPAECMQQMLDQVRHHRVNVDGDVCTVIVTMLVLEGWQRKLDPDYDVLHTLQTLLFKADWAESFFDTIEGLVAP